MNTITEHEKALLLDATRESYIGATCVTHQIHTLCRKLCLAHDALLAQQKIHKENVEMYSGLAASGIVRCADLEKERDEAEKEKDYLLSVLHVCWNWFDDRDDRLTSFELHALLKKVLSL